MLPSSDAIRFIPRRTGTFRVSKVSLLHTRHSRGCHGTASLSSCPFTKHCAAQIALIKIEANCGIHFVYACEILTIHTVTQLLPWYSLSFIYLCGGGIGKEKKHLFENRDTWGEKTQNQSHCHPVSLACSKLVVKAHELPTKKFQGHKYHWNVILDLSYKKQTMGRCFRLVAHTVIITLQGRESQSLIWHGNVIHFSSTDIAVIHGNKKQKSLFIYWQRSCQLVYLLANELQLVSHFRRPCCSLSTSCTWAKLEIRSNRSGGIIIS